MAEDDRDPRLNDGEGEVSQAFLERQADLVLTPVEPDISTSAEATKVLMEQGVDAWRAWVAEHQDDQSTS